LVVGWLCINVGLLLTDKSLASMAAERIVVAWL